MVIWAHRSRSTAENGTGRSSKAGSHFGSATSGTGAGSSTASTPSSIHGAGLAGWSSTPRTSQTGRRSEEALRQSEVLLTSIFQAAPIGIGLVYNRVLGWTNDQVTRMLGYSIEELAEKSARILYESDDEEFERVGREKYIEVRQGGTGVIETRWKRKDSVFLDILLSSKAIDPSDMSAGVVFTALDITDRKRGEEALQRYQDELEQRVQERTSELMVANQALILEIEDRNRADKAMRDSERRLD